MNYPSTFTEISEVYKWSWGSALTLTPARISFITILTWTLSGIISYSTSVPFVWKYHLKNCTGIVLMDYPPKSNHVSSKGYISLYLWHPIFYFEFGSFPHLCSSQQFILSFGRFSIVSMGERKKRWISFCPWFGAKHEKNQILSCNISLYYFEFFSKVALENSHFLIEPIFFCT